MVLPEHYTRFEAGSHSLRRVELPKNVSPRIYLEFALADLAEKSTARTRVNALSNAKRALHFQVDLITQSFGIERLPQSKRRNFNQKIDFLRNLGVTGPEILRKLNKVRNAVEHDYYVPRISQVQDFTDVVELFLAATDRLIYGFPIEMEFIYRKKIDKNAPDISHIYMPLGEGIIYLFVHPGHLKSLSTANLEEWEKKHSIKIEVTEEIPYYKWLNFIIKHIY